MKKKLLFILTVLVISFNLNAEKKRIKDMLELPAYANRGSFQVVFHRAYTTSYSPKHKIPNWVAWDLTNWEVSTSVCKRRNNFKPDPKIKRSPTSKDYSHSGYDRGHMCPAADNKWSAVAMKECFYMSNMCPQLHKLNGGRWKGLEDRCRKWAKRYGKIYIVCGPILEKNVKKRIGPRITVPERFFKAILRQDKKGHYYMIGYIFTQNNDYKVVTIDKIESSTGLNLFHRLPDNIERELEGKVDTRNWLHWDSLK